MLQQYENNRFRKGVSNTWSLLGLRERGYDGFYASGSTGHHPRNDIFLIAHCEDIL